MIMTWLYNGSFESHGREDVCGLRSGWNWMCIEGT